MAKFMAIYTGRPDAAPPDAATVARGGQAWGEWMARNADRLIDAGGPLGKTKAISSGGIADTRNNIAAYVIVEADDHETAARLFESHPHFAIFPGDAVEVMPVMPIPTF